MNAERRYLIEQVLKAAHDRGMFVKGRDQQRFRQYKRHLEQYTDAEIREELKKLTGE